MVAKYEMKLPRISYASHQIEIFALHFGAGLGGGGWVLGEGWWNG